MRTGGTVLHPATGEPAGDGFTLEYATDDGIRLLVNDRAVAERDGVSMVQQVLVAPSGRVVLLMADSTGKKGVVVIADRDNLLATGDTSPGPTRSGEAGDQRTRKGHPPDRIDAR